MERLILKSKKEDDFNPYKTPDILLDQFPELKNNEEDQSNNQVITTLNLSSNSSAQTIISFIKIKKFKKFLNKQTIFSSPYISFQSPISPDYSFSYQITLIPTPTTLSIKIEFTPKNPCITLNEVNIQLSVYVPHSQIFSCASNDNFNVEKNTFYLKDQYITYNKMLIENKMIFPFLLRIRVHQRNEPKICKDEIGITNEGNTCYLNSVIQNIAHIPALRKIIYGIHSKENIFLFTLQKILFKLEKSNSTIKISDVVQSKHFLPLLIPNFPDEPIDDLMPQQQQDAQEIFSYIFDNLLKIDTDKRISNLCEGQLKTQIRCEEINHTSTNKENFLFLSLDCNFDKYGGKSELSIYTCIEQYLKAEPLTGENAYESEIDHKKYDAIKTIYFESLPPILFLHLKRFNQNQTKSCIKITYDSDLNLSNYFSNSNDIDTNYSLYSVIVHEGEIDNGHYLIYIKNFSTNKWFKYNDNIVYQVKNEKEVFDDNFGGLVNDYIIGENSEIFPSFRDSSNTAYILCYILNKKINEIFDCVVKENPKNSSINYSKINNFEENNYNNIEDEIDVYGNNRNNNIFDALINRGIDERIDSTLNYFQGCNKECEKEKNKIFPLQVVENENPSNILTIFDIFINFTQNFYGKDILFQLEKNYPEFNNTYGNILSEIKIVVVNPKKIFLKMIDLNDNRFELSEFFLMDQLRNKANINNSVYLYYIPDKINNNYPIYAIHPYDYLTENVNLPQIRQHFIPNKSDNVHIINSEYDEIKASTSVNKLKQDLFIYNDQSKQIKRLLILQNN